MSSMTRVVVVGVNGYVGRELCALLARHGSVEVVARMGSGRAAAEGDEATPFSARAARERGAEIALLCTPHEASAALAPELLDEGVRVLDLSGAFRLPDAASYRAWYGFEHPAPALLPEASYGLPDFPGAPLGNARLVANPGCYATAAILAIRPLLPVLDPEAPIICDAKSGASGAGKRSELAYSFVELAGNLKAYGIGGHRHEPEIRTYAGIPAARPFLFVPHLLPVVRGLMATCYVTFAAPLGSAEVARVYEAAYGGRKLVRVRPAGSVPELKDVVQTPRAEIGFQCVDGGQRAVVVSVIDNLLKGAASQAVQNLNLMAGRPDAEGLL